MSHGSTDARQAGPGPPAPARPTPRSSGVVPRLADLEADLRARLGAVCRDWPATAFDDLVRRLARMKRRWAEDSFPD